MRAPSRSKGSKTTPTTSLTHAIVILALSSLAQCQGLQQLPPSYATSARHHHDANASMSSTAVRSNDTHITWPDSPVQSRNEAFQESLSFLRNHLMEYDEMNIGSLGFPPENEDAEMTVVAETGRRVQQDQAQENELNLPDGLSNGLVGPTITLALNTKIEYHPWTANIPKPIFQEYVLNFAHVNEGRSNWRPLLYQALKPYMDQLLQSSSQEEEVPVEAVVMKVNQHLWSICPGPSSPTNPISFKAGHTPLIYDPMSVMIYNYASCTGLSILLACALRAVGIPARLAGTPAWNGNPEDGNHSWVEVYDAKDQIWKITEAQPAAGGVFGLQEPCRYWFCNDTKGYGRGTKVYAARLIKEGKQNQDDKDDEEENEGYFPLAWDVNNHGVPGVDRTGFMAEVCSKCSYETSL